MNALYIRKRNKSLQWMLACVAAVDFVIWILFSKLLHVPYENGLVLLTLIVVFFGLGFAAIVLYVLACESYLKAKEVRRASDIAGIVFLCALLTSSLAVAFAAFYGYAWTIHFILPAVLGLAALPLKLMRDRS